MKINRLHALALAALLLPSVNRAEPAPKPAEPHRITLHAAKLPAPALKYRLLPDPKDQVPGNAAAIYYVATSHNLMGAPDDILDKLAVPDAEIPRADAERLIQHYAGSLRQLEIAARRDECRWDSPFRTEGFNTLLPYVGDLRKLARVLAMQARLQVQDGHFDDAARSLQTGYALVRNLNHEAFIIQALVGAAISQVLDNVVELWINTPGSPNLSWALADLPQPFIDMNQGIRLERISLWASLPHMAEAAAGKITSEQLRELLAAMPPQIVEGTPPPAPTPIPDVNALATRDAAAAKASLLKMGCTAEQLEPLQPVQLLGMYYVRSVDYWLQEMHKWHNAPFPQAEAGVNQATEAFKRARELDPKHPLFEVVPAINRVLVTGAQADRRLNELRVLEALRAYAASHDGKLPAKLQDVTDVPVPFDNVTAAEFRYELHGDTATLNAPKPASGKETDGRVYEIKLAK